METILLFGYYSIFLVWSVLIVDALNGKTEVQNGDFIQPRMDALKNKYMKNEDQTWELEATSGHWALIFKYLSVEKSTYCQHDYLEIQETSSNVKDSPRAPTRYCGETAPLPYISETSRLTVRFVTDNIWELKGFNIKVIHSEQREVLESKLHDLSNMYTETLALEADVTYNGDDRDNEPVFYILIGSSAAALAVFCALLTYFVIMMRRQGHTHTTRVPNVFYMSGVQQLGRSSAQRDHFVRLKSATPPITTAQELCNSGKKRYTKNKKNPKQTAVDLTSFKIVVDPSGRSQHNNVYVSNSIVHGALPAPVPNAKRVPPIQS